MKTESKQELRLKIAQLLEENIELKRELSIHRKIILAGVVKVMESKNGTN